MSDKPTYEESEKAEYRHKQIEESLRESEVRLNTLLDATTELAFLAKSDGTFLAVNDALAKSLGKQKEDLIDKPVFDFLGEVAEERKAILQNIVASKKPFQWKDSRAGRYFDNSAYPILDNNGNVKQIAMFAKDYTERRLAEEALRESEEIYRILVKTIPHGIQEIDESGVIIFGNEAYYRLIGYEEGEIIGRAIWDFIEFETASMKEELQEYLKQLVKDQPLPAPYMQKNRRKDGKVIDVQVDWEYKRDKQGLVTGFISVLTDITERKRAEEALRKAFNELDNKTIQLAEINTALSLLLEKKNEDKTAFEDQVLASVKYLITPYLERMKKGKTDDQQKILIGILETNLKEIVSPFAQKLTAKYMNLTPAEIRVADFIRHDKKTKEIAAFLNRSHKTIERHRENIRKKMGIKNKKVHLQTYLLSLQ